MGETYHFTPSRQIYGQVTSNNAYSWNSSSYPNLNYGTDGQNRYMSVGGVGYTHDAQGNLHGDGASTYNYDAYGRLTAVSGGASAAFGYDGLGRLWTTVGGSRTYFLYDGDQIVAEYDGSGNLLRRYVPGADPYETSMWFEGGSVRWLLADRRGSIMGSADGGQALSTQNTYDESGVPGSTNAGRLQLNGLPWIPEAGLYLFGAGAPPALSRFLQPNPFV